MHWGIQKSYSGGTKNGSEHKSFCTQLLSLERVRKTEDWGGRLKNDRFRAVKIGVLKSADVRNIPKLSSGHSGAGVSERDRFRTSKGPFLNAPSHFCGGLVIAVLN